MKSTYEFEFSAKIPKCLFITMTLKQFGRNYPQIMTKKKRYITVKNIVEAHNFSGKGNQSKCKEKSSYIKNKKIKTP